MNPKTKEKEETAASPLIILMTSDNKKVVINLDEDTFLFKDIRIARGTEILLKSGTDLFTHKAKSGQNYFYRHEWSKQAGAPDFYTLMTNEEVKAFILKRAGDPMRGALTEENIKAAQKEFPDIFDETA